MKRHQIPFYLLIAGLAVASGVAMAQGINIGGTDASGQMTEVRSLATTLQTIGFKWVAPVIGGFLVIAGISKIAARDFVHGIIGVASGGTLFFVQKIAESLAKMGGN